jgi:Uma2 family endonuclease
MAIAARPARRRRIGPADHGRRMTLDEFIKTDFQEGWLYELARGVVEVTEVPDPWHGRIVGELVRLFILYDGDHPGCIEYQSSRANCAIRLPAIMSSRRPDQAIYLDPEPPIPEVWARWVPHIVVEVVSPDSEDRDFIAKREEYLWAGVREYWILDPKKRQMHALVREGDTWAEIIVPARGVFRTILLPGLEVRPGELLGRAGE